MDIIQLWCGERIVQYAKSDVQHNNFMFNDSNKYLLAIGGHVEYHNNHNVFDHAILDIDNMHISSIVLTNFIWILLLLRIIWFDAMDDMLKYGMQIVKILLLLCSLMLLISLLWVGNK